jgi:hypothetical protein
VRSRRAATDGALFSLCFPASGSGAVRPVRVLSRRPSRAPAGDGGRQPKTFLIGALRIFFIADVLRSR